MSDVTIPTKDIERLAITDDTPRTLSWTEQLVRAVTVDPECAPYAWSCVCSGDPEMRLRAVKKSIEVATQAMQRTEDPAETLRRLRDPEYADKYPSDDDVVELVRTVISPQPEWSIFAKVVLAHAAARLLRLAFQYQYGITYERLLLMYENNCAAVAKYLEANGITVEIVDVPIPDEQNRDYRL